MNIEHLTHKIKKISEEIKGLTADVENNCLRRAFYIDIIKQRIFDLYDLTEELNNQCSETYKNKDNSFLNSQKKHSGMFRTELDEAEKRANESTQNTVEEQKPEIPEQPIEPAIEEEENKSNIDLFSEKGNLKELISTKIEEEIEEEVQEEIIEETIEETVEEVEPEPEVIEVSEPEIKPVQAPLTGDSDTEKWLIRLLDEISERKLSSNDISHKLQSAPIDNFYNSVSISQKHLYIDELFGGKAEVYKNTLKIIEDNGNLSDAISYLSTEAVPVFRWADKEKTVSEFLFLIKRRFS